MLNILTKFINYNKNIIGIINLNSKQKRKILPVLYILLFVLLYFLIDFSTQSLVAHDEGLYARRSRLLEQSYNWFSSPFSTPHHKTLGSYWFIALSIRLFGTSEMALRFPSILASFLCLFILYLIAFKITNKRTALISIVSLSSMPLWIKYSRYASPDVLFVLCILLIILFFLEFLDSNNNFNKYFYVFICGLFVSISFFIRSYMALVPIIGLTPFLTYSLLKEKNIFRIIFLNGIFIGSIPTFLNLYFSYQKFGIRGITSLFDFAKKQAIGGADFNNFLFVPLNYIYLTFPVGILLVILIIFTRSHNYIKYPLLVYFYPGLSLFILLCMSTSYPHYYLFILPSLSIIFANKLNNYSFKSSVSKYTSKFLLSFFMILVSCALVSLVLYFNDSLIEYSGGRKLLVYLVSFLLVLSYIYSIRFLFDSNNKRIDLKEFFYNLAIPQYISLSLLFNFGILGNPNYQTKLFLNDEVVTPIINSNTMYLLNLDSKTQTLLSYYLPYSKIIKPSDDLSMYDYIITSDTSVLNNFNPENPFKLIKKLDKHFLFMNIGK